MKRRSFLRTAAAAMAGTVASITAAPAIASGKRTWRLITTWPKNLPGLGTGAQYFADQVTRCSGGRLTIKLYASGEIVPAFESIDAVASGSVEMGHGSPYYWKGKAPATQFVSNIPFGLTAQEYNAWYHYGGGKELCDEVYREQLGCKFLVCGNTGVQHPGWCTKDVNTLDDFKGLKMRIPGLAGEIMQRVGATVVNLPGSEVAPALASGAIDWVEWNNPYGEASMGFWRYAKYYYTPGWHEPGTVLELFVNSKAWDELPKDLQAIVEQCAYATNEVMLSEFVARSAPQLDNFVKKHDVVVKRLSDDVLRHIADVSDEVVTELANKDPLSKKIYESMSKFRSLQVGYSRVTEGDFFAARSLKY